MTPSRLRHRPTSSRRDRRSRDPTQAAEGPVPARGGLARAPGGQRARYRPLLWRVVAINAIVLLVACVVTIRELSPGRLAQLAPEEALILVSSLGALILGNLLLLRRALMPLQQLTRLTREVDPTRPGQRVSIDGHDSEATELARAFNEMLARLEAERRESARRALAAQESERLRIAQELHDDVGQTLTAVLLQLERTAKHVDEPTRGELVEAQDTARGGLDDVRRLALELRPEALDELGLASALAALCDRLTERTGLRVERHIARDLPPLPEESELVLYRVAQEALTNVVRHAETNKAELRVEQAPDRVTLSVLDSGRGLGAAGPREGTGLRGMRERAMLIGADLSVRSRPQGGVAVRLDVPIGEDGLWYR
jgi:two-component system sensor histidine kinase UhpB